MRIVDSRSDGEKNTARKYEKKPHNKYVYLTKN